MGIHGVGIIPIRQMGLIPRGRDLTFLLRDDFLTDEAAPLASPRTCEPGPGTLTLVQNDGQFSIAGEELVFPAQITPVFGDQTFVGPQIARVGGVAYISRLTVTNNDSAWIGFNNDATPGTPVTNNTLQLYFVFIGTLNAYITVAVATDLGAFASGTYEVAIVMRSVGHFVLANGGTFAQWTLLWVSDLNAGDGWPCLSNFDQNGVMDTVRVIDLPVNNFNVWSTDFGIATFQLAGARAPGDTFIHEADCLIEFEATGIGGINDIDFRRSGAGNLWRIETNAAGDLLLIERNATVNTTRITGAAVLAGGDRVVCIAVGNVYRLYQDNFTVGTYTDPGAFNIAETAGVLSAEGGAISDIVTWPRTLSGQAQSSLAAAAL